MEQDESSTRRSFSRRVLANASWAGVARIIAIALNLVTVPVFMARLGVTGYGIYVLIQGFVGVTGLFSLGFGEAAIKYMAEGRARRDAQLVGRYFRNALWLFIIVSCLGFLLLAIASSAVVGGIFRIAPEHRAVARAALVWFGCAWAFRNVNSAFSTIPAADQRYDIVIAIRDGANILERLLGLIVVTCGGGLTTVFQSQMIPQLLAMLCYWIVDKRLLPEVSLLPSCDATVFRKFARFGLWQSLSSVLAELSQNLDRFFIGVMISTRAVAYYGAVQAAVAGIGGILGSLSSVLVPTFSHIEARHGGDRSARVFMDSTWVLNVLGAMVCVPLAWCAWEFLSLWLGPGATGETHRLLIILLSAQILAGATLVQNTYLVGIGRTEWNAWIALAGVATVFATNWVSLASFAEYGEGWSRIAAALSGWVGLWLMRRKMFMSLDTRAYYGALFGPSLIGLGCVAGGYLWTRNAVHLATGSWVGLAWYGGMGAVVVGLVILLVDSAVDGQGGRWRSVLRILRLSTAGVP